MATSFTPDAMRGLMIADPRIDVASPASSSSFTEAEPTAGVPVPSITTRLALSTTGTQTAGTQVDVRTIRAGSAIGTTSSSPGAFAWRDDGGAWYGWDGPLAYNGFDPVHTWATGFGASLYGSPHVAYTPDGTRLIATKTATSIGVTQSLRVHRRPDGGTSSYVDVETVSTSGGSFRPCLVNLPDRRILLLSTYEDLQSAGIQVRAWLSVDDGVTWVLQSAACLPSYIDTTTITVRRLRAAYSGGQILMMLAIRDTDPSLAVPDTFYQYASIDEGFSFSLVEKVAQDDINSVHTGGVHDIVAVPDYGFVVVYCGSSNAVFGNNSAVLAKTFASAFMVWTSQDKTTVDGLTSPSSLLSVANELDDDTELCASVDDDGQVYAFAPDYLHDARVSASRSRSFGSWVALGVPSSANSCTGYGTEKPTIMTCAWYAGALHLIHSVDATTTYDEQLGDTVLSGYTSATVPMMPSVQSGGDYSASSFLTWEPWWVPSSAGWTATTTGVPIVTLTGGAMQISTGATDSVSYKATRPTSMFGNHTLQAMFEVDVDSGNTATVTMNADTVTHGYHVRIKVTPTLVIVEDQTGPTTITTYTRTSTNYIHVRAWVTNNGATGKVTVWIDEVDGTTGAPRNYVRIVDGAALGDSPTGSVRQEVTFGHITGLLSCVSNWRYVAVQYSSVMSSPHGLTIPDDMNGREYTPYGRVLSQGLRLHAVGGPSAVNDEWAVPPRYGYPETSLASPSPSVTWRSVGTASAQTFVWETSTTAANITPLMGPVGALYIGGANFRTATLEGRNAAGAWVSIGTWDASSGQASLAWDRKHDAVAPSTANASSGIYWYPHAALDSMRWTFDTATGPVRTIRYQTEGAWTKEATKHARLALWGDMTGIPTSGTSGAVMASSGLLVWNTDAAFSAYRLTIPVQPVAETYYEMGVVRIGHLAAFGRRYSWGRNLTLETNTELRTGSNGRRTSLVRGPSRRGVEFGWTDAADQSMFTTDQTSERPDYFLATTTGTPEAAAAKHDGPILMRGIVDHLNGSAEPVVYVAYLPRVALNSTQMVVHPDLHLYGRIVSDVSIETVQGKEWAGTGSTGEMVRTSNVRVEEEL